MRKVAVILALALAFWGVLALSAQAVPTLEFLVPDNAAGIIFMDPDGLGVRGENITVTEVVGHDTPAHSEVHLSLTQGLLFFQTGDNSGIVDGSTYLFSAGRFIRLTGAVPDTSPEITGLNTVLFSGVFTGIPEVDVASGGGKGTVVGTFSDTKNDILAAYYGLAGNAFTSGNINISFAPVTGPLNPPDSFRGVVSGGYVSNVVDAVPLAPSVLLLGSGLLALLGLPLRRK